MRDIEKVHLSAKFYSLHPQELVRLLPASYLGKLGLFQAPNLIELVVDAYKVRSTRLAPRTVLTLHFVIS